LAVNGRASPTALPKGKPRRFGIWDFGFGIFGTARPDRIQLSPAKAGSEELFGRQRSGEPDRTAKGQAREILDFGFWILERRSLSARRKGKPGGFWILDFGKAQPFRSAKGQAREISDFGFWNGTARPHCQRVSLGNALPRC